MQVFGEKSPQCRRNSKCKGPETRICLCFRTIRKATVAGEERVKESMRENEDKEGARASSGRLGRPWQGFKSVSLVLFWFGLICDRSPMKGWPLGEMGSH